MCAYVYHAGAHENSATNRRSTPTGMRVTVTPEHGDDSNWCWCRGISIIVSDDECPLSHTLPNNERRSGRGGKDASDMFLVRESLRCHVALAPRQKRESGGSGAARRAAEGMERMNQQRGEEGGEAR